MTNWNAKQHSYEELRTLVIDELLAHTCRSFDELQEKVSQAILKRDNQWPPRDTGMAYASATAYLHANDRINITLRCLSSSCNIVSIFSAILYQTAEPMTHSHDRSPKSRYSHPIATSRISAMSLQVQRWAR